MQSKRRWSMLFLKGIAMGAADAVPGVSGGTIAFISGIYEELLQSIRRVTPANLMLLLRGGPKAFWEKINGTFLLVLFSGVLVSLITLSRAAVYLLQNHPSLLWAFFFGLIVSSTLWMLKQIGEWNQRNLLMLVVGCVSAAAISVMSPVEAPMTPLVIVLSGSIAICAMILPGISGSFILLLLGMYGPIMGAIKNFDIGVLGLFLGGCVAGLLSFSHLLGWLFRHYRAMTLSLLTGFMMGSLVKVWPWKFTTQYRVNSHGDQIPLVQGNVLPFDYQALTGHDPMLLFALALMVLGGLLVYILEAKMNSDR